jgi:hypothetical protein
VGVFADPGVGVAAIPNPVVEQRIRHPITAIEKTRRPFIPLLPLVSADLSPRPQKQDLL